MQTQIKVCSRARWYLFYLHLNSCNSTVIVVRRCDFRSPLKEFQSGGEGGFSTRIFLSIGTKQQGHSIAAIVFNTAGGDIYILGAFPSFKEIVSVSVQNSHDRQIERSFEVRGHPSVILLVSITGWPLWPEQGNGEEADFLLSPRLLQPVKTQRLLMVWMVLIKGTVSVQIDAADQEIL